MALERLIAAGIRICKVQISSALRVGCRPTPDALLALDAFAEDTYLHQVVERSHAGRDPLRRSAGGVARRAPAL